MTPRLGNTGLLFLFCMQKYFIFQSVIVGFKSIQYFEITSIIVGVLKSAFVSVLPVVSMLSGIIYALIFMKGYIK